MPITLPALPVDAPKFRWEPWDAGSKPGRTDEAIRAGDFIYVPGEYNRVEDVGGTEYTRLYVSRFSALDPYGLDTTWNPAPNGRVVTICYDEVNGIVYMGGQFTSIAGSARTRLAAFTNVLDPADPDLNARFGGGFAGANAGVTAVELDGDGDLWVGGSFGTLGGSTRERLAKLNVGSTTVTVRSSPGNLAPAAVFGSQRDVQDLCYDAVNDQMLVAFRNSVTIAGQTGKLFAMSLDGTIRWAVNPLSSSNAAFTFQLAIDEIQAYLALNGSNWSYAYRLTDGALRWTYHSDGNNQGIQTLGGYIFITHHGDWVAATKDNGTANNTTPKSVGIYALDQNGVLQSWRPELRFPPGDPYGVSVLKGFDIGKDEASGQLYVGGDQGGAYDAASGDSINARRMCFFDGDNIVPPPPPNTFRLTVNIGGAGSGTVVSTPAGINSKTTAVFDFDEDEVVTLMATPDAGSEPVNWSGSGTGSAPRSITMSADKSVTATFALTVGGGGGYGGPGDGVPILLAGGDFLAGNGRPDGGRPGVAALLQPYFDQDDAIGFVTLGDHAYNEGTLAQFDGFDEDFGAMDRKNGRDFLFPTPGSHDYGSWGTATATVGMTAFDSYFEGLGLTVDNDDVANQFYRVDDIIDADGGATSWRLLRINGVLARSGFAQTQGGQQDGLIIPMKAGSPQYAFIQETMQAAKDDGKFLVIASAHPRWTSPSPSNHTNESRIGPAWDLADAILPGRCVFISGHQHNYERFEPQKADGTVDASVGHVQFVAGTAGNPSYAVTTPSANSAALNWDDAGLLELTLRDNGYGFRYVLNDGSVFDEGEVSMSTGGGGSGSSTLQTTFDNAAVNDGDNLTVANSSGGGDALNDVVKTGTGVTIKYETTNPAQGSKGIQVVVPGTTTTTKRGYIEHLLTTASAYPDIMFRPYQAAWSVIMSGHSLDGTKRWSVVLRKDGRVELRNRKNAVVGTSTAKISVAAWNRIAVKAVLGGSQSQNILEMRIYQSDLTTIAETVTVTNVNLGETAIGLMDLYRVGLLNSSRNNRTLDIDMFRVQDSGYFGQVDPPTIEGWVFDASGPPGGGGPNGIVADPNTSGVYHTIWDVGGYRRSTPESDLFEMRMKGNSHDSQRKTAAIRAKDSGVATRLLLGGGFNPAGYSESLDGGDEWALLTAISGGFNSQSPSAPDTTYLPHIPRSTGQLVDYDGGTGNRYWGTFADGVKRYPGTGSPVVISMGANGSDKWFIRNLWLDPQVSTTLYVATYNDSQGRGGVWRITNVDTGTGKTPTRMTPAAIGQVNKIIWSEDGNRMYAVCGVDGIWRATRAGGFTDWVDIGGTRISKQAEWCGGDVYSNGSNDVLVIVCHDPAHVDVNGDPGATTGNRYGSVYVCDAAQTGSSPTWIYVSDPGTAGYPGGGDADINVNSRLTGKRFWKADDNSGSNMLGRSNSDVVDFAWNRLSTDGATKEGMLVGGGGAAWFTDDNARTWQVTPDGCTIVSCMGVFQDQARPTYSWQVIQDWDAFFIKDITEEHPTWMRTPNVQNYTTAYGGFGAPDGSVLLLEGDPPAADTNEGEVLRWAGAGTDPTWTAIGGNNKSGNNAIFGLPSRRPLACTKVKLANGTGRWIVYLENGGIWWLNDGSSTWTQASGFPTFAGGNYRQHDMWAPNAWWTGSNTGADGIVFLGVRDSANGGLWVSDDYGASWNKKVTDNGASLYVAAARGQSSIVYLSGGSGVRRITNPATMSLNQAGRIDAVTGFGGNPATIAFHNNGDLYVYCGPSAGVYPRIWQCPDPSTTLTTFDNKVDICDPTDGSAADDSGQAALQYVNNMVFQGDILAIACAGGGVVRGRPRV